MTRDGLLERTREVLADIDATLVAADTLVLRAAVDRLFAHPDEDHPVLSGNRYVHTDECFEYGSWCDRSRLDPPIGPGLGPLAHYGAHGDGDSVPGDWRRQLNMPDHVAHDGYMFDPAWADARGPLVARRTVDHRDDLMGWRCELVDSRQITSANPPV